MKRWHKVLLSVLGILGIGAVGVAALVFTAFQDKPCIGISDAEIQNFAIPEVVASIGESPKKIKNVLSPAKKTQLIELLTKNSRDWSQSWHTARGYETYLNFQLDRFWLQGLGVGDHFLARGACQRDLSAADARVLQDLLH